jgi:hypothetical protein
MGAPVHKGAHRLEPKHPRWRWFRQHSVHPCSDGTKPGGLSLHGHVRAQAREAPKSGPSAELGAAKRRYHETYDLLLTPALPLAASETGKERPDPLDQLGAVLQSVQLDPAAGGLGA